jgi:hypothetical protein
MYYNPFPLLLPLLLMFDGFRLHLLTVFMVHILYPIPPLSFAYSTISLDHGSFDSYGTRLVEANKRDDICNVTSLRNKN